MTQEFSSRVSSAVQARSHMENDFFGGWQPDDIELFCKYRSAIAPVPGCITDFFGARTPVSCIPWAERHSGAVLADPPVPDDGIRAEAIEYFALLNSLDSSTSNSFTMIELGASYAPWACLAGVLARSRGKTKISLKAVEASAFFQGLISRNVDVNKLNESTASCETIFSVVHGAVGVAGGDTYFPVVKSAMENGGQTSSVDATSDYVGREIAHERVRMYTLATILEDYPEVDFLHCDIQGSEREVMISSAELLTRKVKHMFIGTHSRRIEGELIECFHAAGWHLERERPVMFVHRPELKDTVGMTTRDGGQYWVNANLR
jgi:FkbM family methyltransferase